MSCVQVFISLKIEIAFYTILKICIWSNTVVSNHFHSVKNFLFSSAKPRDLDGMLGTGLPVSMYTTKTPIDKCRFNVTQLKEFSYIVCKRQISITLFYLYQKLQCTDNYFFKIKFVLFLYLLLSAILATKAYRTMYDFLKRESS